MVLESCEYFLRESRRFLSTECSKMSNAGQELHVICFINFAKMYILLFHVSVKRGGVSFKICFFW